MSSCARGAGRMFAAVLVSLGVAGVVSASSISGSYSFTFGSSVTDASCNSAIDDGYRDYFSATGSNNIGGTDTIALSDCESVNGYSLDGGMGFISDSAGTFNASFNETYTGMNATSYILTGVFEVTSATGAYAGVVGGPVVTYENYDPNTGDYLGTGTFQFQSAPEPASFLLIGCGLLGGAGWIRRRRAGEC